MTREDRIEEGGRKDKNLTRIKISGSWIISILTFFCILCHSHKYVIPDNVKMIPTIIIKQQQPKDRNFHSGTLIKFTIKYVFNDHFNILRMYII